MESNKRGFFDWVEGPAIIQLMEPLTQEDIDKGQVRPKLDKEGRPIYGKVETDTNYG